MKDRPAYTLDHTDFGKPKWRQFFIVDAQGRPFLRTATYGVGSEAAQKAEAWLQDAVSRMNAAANEARKPLSSPVDRLNDGI